MRSFWGKVKVWVKVWWWKFLVWKGWDIKWQLMGPKELEYYFPYPIGESDPKNEQKVSAFLDRMESNNQNPNQSLANEWIERMAKDKECLQLKIDSAGVFLLNFSEGSGFDEVLNGPEHFVKLYVNAAIDGLEISNAKIHRLQIHNAVKGLVSIENCLINFITFRPGSESLTIYNSWVGSLELGPASLKTFYSSRSWFGSIECPTPDQENPFGGFVDFNDVKIPTSQQSTLHNTGAQPFRNMRSHMEKLGNGPMAGYMRAKELASERETTDSWVTKSFNYLYWIASGYSLKPGKALLWAFGFLAASTIFLWSTDGVNVTAESGTWQMDLCKEGNWNRLGRAVVLSAQTTINPLSVFNSKSAFTFKTTIGAGVDFLSSVAGWGSMLFAIFAIRKRMKFL